MSKFHTLRVGEAMCLHVAGPIPERLQIDTNAQIFIGSSETAVRQGGAGTLPVEASANPSFVIGPNQRVYAGRVGAPALVTMQVFPLDEFGYDLSG